VDRVVQTGQKRGLGVGAFLLALVTAGALAHVGVRMKGIEVAYDLGREKRVNTQLEEERRRLNIEIGMLKDPVRVVAIARETLKMGPPAPTAIVRIVPGQVLGAPLAPQASARASGVGPRASGRASGLGPQASGRIRSPKAEAPGPRPEAPAADEPPASGDVPTQEAE
jgi:cell division protein FtsL